MAKLRTWEYKNKKRPRKYHTSMGITDYDIPMFGYRSALVILFSTFLPLLVVPTLCDAIGIDYRMLTVIITGLCSGFSVAYSQFFIERKEGVCRSFWIVGGLLSVFIALLIFLLVYMGVIL